MTQELEELVERARKIEMTPDQLREQRRSFVYGNTHIENERITREMVAEVDARLEAGERRLMAGDRHSIAEQPERITDPLEIARREAENGVRQFRMGASPTLTHKAHRHSGYPLAYPLTRPLFSTQQVVIGPLGNPLTLADLPSGADANAASLAPPLRDGRRRRRHRTADTSNELPPSHSITSSARARRVGGIVRPSALAVLRLMISSSFVRCSNGSRLVWLRRRSCRRTKPSGGRWHESPARRTTALRSW